MGLLRSKDSAEKKREKFGQWCRDIGGDIPDRDQGDIQTCILDGKKVSRGRSEFASPGSLIVDHQEGPRESTLVSMGRVTHDFGRDYQSRVSGLNVELEVSEIRSERDQFFLP